MYTRSTSGEGETSVAMPGSDFDHGIATYIAFSSAKSSRPTAYPYPCKRDGALRTTTLLVHRQPNAAGVNLNGGSTALTELCPALALVFSATDELPCCQCRVAALSNPGSLTPLAMRDCGDSLVVCRRPRRCQRMGHTSEW